LATLPIRSSRRSARHSVSTATKLLGAGVALAALLAAYLLWSWSRPLHPGSETYIVKPGTGLYALTAELQRRGALWETRSFRLLGLITLRQHEVKAGEYRFRDRMSARELLTQVAEGRVVEYPLRLLEGRTFRQLRDELAKAPRLTQTLAGLSDAQIMTKLDAPNVHPEGRFYPDTYFYTSGYTDLMILQRAYDKMQARLLREWDNRDEDLPYRSVDEALIMASIIEKETGRADERRLVAGVFINRLKKNMRLETDPSVIYGLGTKFDGNLRKRDLLTDTPYNSYTRRGLPPTPIAMPSNESLYAALHPEKTQAIFFVARGDGTHEYSDTFEAHMRAVSKYQLGGRPYPSSTANGTPTPKAP